MTTTAAARQAKTPATVIITDDIDRVLTNQGYSGDYGNEWHGYEYTARFNGRTYTKVRTYMDDPESGEVTVVLLNPSGVLLAKTSASGLGAVAVATGATAAYLEG